MEFNGQLRKLQTKHLKNTVRYTLNYDDQSLDMNSLIGNSVRLSFSGDIFCVDTGKKIKKSYNQGYSWESYITRAQCDSCIFKPELCHYSVGTCREPEWGEEHCLKPHVVYLAYSSGVKVGITREKNVPHRWMDQGAICALPLFEVGDRKTSGMVEVELAKKFNDKTNWRTMLKLKNDFSDFDLEKVKKEIISEFKELIAKNKAKILETKPYRFEYPMINEDYKLSALSFDKTPVVAGKLVGVKGQYLLLDIGVLNIRKHQGYQVKIEKV